MNFSQKHDQKTVDTVVQMWKDHKTGGDIAHKLKLTRNAVMGLLARLRSKGVIEYRDPGAKKNGSPDEKRNKLRNPYVPNMRKKKLPPLPPVIKDVSPIQLFDLKPMSCRFVINDSSKPSEFLFCGMPKETGSYCKEHHAICYIRAEPRKKGKQRKPFQLNPRYTEKK